MSDKAFQYESTGDKVRDTQRIQVLLKRVIDERVLLTVTLPGVNGHFSSAIIEIDPAQDFILLDELTPQAGHNQFVKKKQMNVQARLHGVNLQFKAELRGLVRDENGLAYRIDYPAEVSYHQKRAHFRVKLGITAAATVRFYPEESRPVEGELVDISEGGICAVLDSAISELKIGTSFPCSIHLDDEVIRCDLETRSVRSEGDRSQQLRAGFRFTELTPPQKKHVARIVARMQREALRKPH